jgi:hypothetical protein
MTATTNQTVSLVMSKARTAKKTGSLERVLRTIFQVLVAAVPTIPILVNTLGLSAQTAAEVTGIGGLVVVIVFGLHNTLESAGILPSMLKDLPLPTLTPQLASTAQAIAPSIVADVAKAQAAAPVVAPVIAVAQSGVPQAPSVAPYVAPTAPPAQG